MEKLIRRVLLFASIGGGSIGSIMVAIDIATSDQLTKETVISNGLLIVVFIYTVYAGLQFSRSRSSIKNLTRAFFLQIPWITSPIISFKIASGIGASFAIIYSTLNYKYRLSLGADYTLSLYSDQPLGIGINLAAVSFLIFIQLYKNPSEN
ncbi:hypothetical protein [Microbulbifer variabilis]|uniref:hypothetical protein n=1 Tax=Microbulbifer variabilis TaxID=266805 RepID=UPI001CFDFEED|nr:hypothetical protein [Microbulbifer variabilis]